MCAENNNERKKNNTGCSWYDGMAEMMRGCFPGSTDYSDCFPWMNKNWGRFCGQKTDGTGRKENRDCCC
jgi:hypothetical protein